MMLDSPHTSVAMLIRGTSLLQCVFHPTNHVQDIHPTDNPPLSARKSWAAVERHNVESDNNWRGSRAQPAKICVHWCMQSSAPAPGEQSPWDSPLGAIEGSISQCTFLQMTYTAENLHTDGNTPVILCSTASRPSCLLCTWSLGPDSGMESASSDEDMSSSLVSVLQQLPHRPSV